MYIQLLSNGSETFKQYYYLNDKNHISYLGPISYINFFVGANNSGKSRLMRELIKIADYGIIRNNVLIENLENIECLLAAITKKIDKNKPFSFNIKKTNPSISFSKEDAAIQREMIGAKISGNVTVDPTFFSQIINKYLQLKNDFINKELVEIPKNALLGHYNKVLEICKVVLENNPNDRNNDHFDLINTHTLLIIKNEVIELIETQKKFFDNYNVEKTSAYKIFIPILRTPLNLGLGDNDIYENFIKTRYELTGQKIEIFTGLKLYDKIFKDTTSIKEIRKKHEQFQKFLQDTFFGTDFELTAINEQHPSNNHLTVTLENEREIHNIGDGISGIIMLMHKIFHADNFSWVFIEEPEINLHPGYQRLFLDTLLKNEYIRNKQLKIFISTHSNHLLDLSLNEPDDVSIFVLEKYIENEEEKFYIDPVQNNDLKVLNVLGVNNSSVLMANCSIWVEGITDRYYLKKYLKEYFSVNNLAKLFIEDLHYTFFEYSGSNLSHYLFTNKKEILENPENIKKIKGQFLSNRIYLIADQDKGKEMKHSWFGDQQSNSFKYYVTEGIEIENIISEEVLKITLPLLFRKLNKPDINMISEKEYRNIKLGKYLQNKFSKKIPKSAVEASGTLSNEYKKRLAKLILENDNISWKHLGIKAQTLTEAIYNFIEKNNHIKQKKDA